MEEFNITELKGAYLLTIGSVSIGFEHYEVHDGTLVLFGAIERIPFKISSQALEQEVLLKLNEMDDA
jgi:hypothetical protein